MKSLYRKILQVNQGMCLLVQKVFLGKKIWFSRKYFSKSANINTGYAVPPVVFIATSYISIAFKLESPAWFLMLRTHNKPMCAGCPSSPSCRPHLPWLHTGKGGEKTQIWKKQAHNSPYISVQKHCIILLVLPPVCWGTSDISTKSQTHCSYPDSSLQETLN